MADPKAYYFVKPEDTDTTCKLLEDVVKDKKLTVEISLERRLVRGFDGEQYSDNLKGMFRNQRGQHITFTVPPARDGGNLFEGVELSPFDLQEFDEDGELSKFADSIIQKLHEVYLKHREAHEWGNDAKYLFQRPVSKRELLGVLKEAAKAEDSNFKFIKETKEGIYGDFFSRSKGDLYIHFGVHINKAKKYTEVQFSEKELHDSCVGCERSYPYLVKYVRSLVSHIQSADINKQFSSQIPKYDYGLRDGDKGDRNGGCEQA